MDSTIFDKMDRDHSWHPFTQMEEYCSIPQLQVERGQGCWIWDTEGNRYLDGNASIWTNAHGHNEPDINAALVEQLGKIAHSTYLGLSHPVGAMLGQRLAELAPESLSRVVFSDNGSNAVEIALKLSFQYWQLVGKPEKRLVVGMENGYHGDTFGAMAAGNSDSFHGRFQPWLFESRKFAAPECSEVNGIVKHSDSDQSLLQLEKVLENEASEIASVIIEPSIQGPAGMRLQPAGFLKQVEVLCRRYGVHLILDEVFVGCGRTGSIFACEQEGVYPDFLCLAKGLTAGYLPLAATLTTEKVYRAFLGSFDTGNAFYHGHTFTGNPLAASVALKSLEKLERLIGSRRLDKTIEDFGRILAETFNGHSNVMDIRQRGLAAAIDLFPGSSRDSWHPNDRVGMKVCLEARKHGLLLRPLLDSILVVPPLVINEEEIGFLFNSLKTAIDAVMNNIGN
jgi:adenosylmethionine-8-amino-7-oxononanoate aminotransferase